MKEDNPHRCDSFYRYNDEKFRCMLPVDHKEDEHMWYITWNEEESEIDNMQ